MARMSIDDSALRDPRVLRLAKRLGWSRRETIGALLDVWAVAYDRATDLLPQEDIDIAAECDTFACDMERVGLARLVMKGKQPFVRLMGAAERVAYLASRQESGRRGGLKSGEARRNNGTIETEISQSLDGQQSEAKSKVCFKQTEAPLNPNTNILPSASANPDPRVNTDPPKPPKGVRSGGSKTESWTDSEIRAAEVVLEKLSARSKIKYRGSDEHKRLIISRLRDGASESDLRAVVGYCAVELEWASKPEMARYLRPETLFGPKTIERYLDAARNWFEKLPGDRKSPTEGSS